MIRVGRIDAYGRHPSYPEFEPIVVMTRSSRYGSLGPYVLKDAQNRIMENIWQFSKVYDRVPATTARRSRYDSTIIWNHPAEQHVVSAGETKELEHMTLTPAYWQWRHKGMSAKDPIRYPVGFHYRHQCLCALPLDARPDTPLRPLSYISSRKEIYLPLYASLVQSQRQFSTLRAKLNSGINLLILEVDGPHQESLAYYKQTYGVHDQFIERNTVLVNESSMRILLHDDKHPFGHGYCLAMTLLEKEQYPLWLTAPVTSLQPQNPLVSAVSAVSAEPTFY